MSKSSAMKYMTLTMMINIISLYDYSSNYRSVENCQYRATYLPSHNNVEDERFELRMVCLPVRGILGLKRQPHRPPDPPSSLWVGGVGTALASPGEDLTSRLGGLET